MKCGAPCELWDTCKNPCIEPDARNVPDDKAADVMFIGEAPGADEDEQGIPFVGRSGQLLREMVMEAGLQHYFTVYTNVVRCRPPGNKIKAKYTKRCLPNLLDDIDEYDPRIIVLLGNVPLKAILGETGITNWRGVVVERDGRVYVPTFHPAYVLRNTSSLLTVMEDLERVYSLLGGEEIEAADSDYVVSVVNSLPRARAMIDIIQNAGECSFDTETTALRLFDEGERMVMCSLAVDTPKKAWVVLPNKEYNSLVASLLKDDSIGKIGHNMKFDCMAVAAFWDSWVNNVAGDSMLLSYVLDSQPGRHGLKVLAGRFLGMYDYDRELSEYCETDRDADPSRGGNYGNVPVDILTDYAAKDAIATLELHKRLYGELSDEQRVLYEELVLPASNVLTQMECNGVKLDQDVVERYTLLYRGEQDRQFVAMEDDATFKKFVKDRKTRDSGYEFNPNSTYQVRDLLYSRRYFGLKPLGTTDTGLPSTKWDYLKPYADSVPFLKHFRYWKLLSKVIGTYLEPAAEEWPSTSDGLVRASYLLHGTVTGRLSSRKPNLQNIPTPEKEPGTILAEYPVKDIFTHRWKGGCLLAADYSGMELRTMASVSDCEGMARAFEEGKDVHSIVACALYGLDYDEFVARRESSDEAIAAEANALRYRAKWVNWTLLYGGNEHTLYRLYGLEEEEASRLVHTYYTMFPEVLDYKKQTLAFASEFGYVESLFGRRRYLPYINDPSNSYRAQAQREAINMPIQSAASDVLLCSLIVLDDKMMEQDVKSKMVNTVHDSVMFDVYPGELELMAYMCRDVMENIAEYADCYFPGLDLSWFTVPLKVDMEYGSHYGSLEHYKLEG